MLQRLISSLIGLPILLFVVFMGGIYIQVAALVLSIIGLHEFYHAFREKGYCPMEKLGYLFSILVFAGFYFQFKPIAYIGTVLLFVYVLLTYNVFSEHDAIMDVALSFLGFFYVSFSFFHIALLSRLDNPHLIWFIFIIAWGSDTCAYFVGKFFGKRKLLPQVSPKKTVAGAIGGVIGATLVAAVFSIVIIPDFFWYAIFVGIFGSMLSQIGDLIASKIKRYCGIKDFGKIMPGHGGVLDRFDSIVLAAPFLYYVVQVYLNKPF